MDEEERRTGSWHQRRAVVSVREAASAEGSADDTSRRLVTPRHGVTPSLVVATILAVVLAISVTWLRPSATGPGPSGGGGAGAAGGAGTTGGAGGTDLAGPIASTATPPSPLSPPPAAESLAPSPQPSATTPATLPRAKALAANWLRSLPTYLVHGPSSRKVIALTLDADMYPWMYAERGSVTEFDPRILSLLVATHTPATIFLNGLWAKAYPSVVKRMATDPGLELANHSWDHAAWLTPCPNTAPIAPPMTQRTEVTDAAALIRRLTGEQIRYFRFPGGCHTTAEAIAVRGLSEEPIGWDCFFGDTYGWSASQQIASVEHGCVSGSIVITHLNGPPFHPSVYEALKTLIGWWKRNGWTVVNVSELLGLPTATAH